MDMRTKLLHGAWIFALLGACSSEPEPEGEPMVEEDSSGDDTVVAGIAVEWQPPEDVHIEGDHLTIDRHINFETDSDVILADSYELLDHIADLLKHHPEIEHLKIIGHTDEAGGHDHNQELSERRASAVVTALQQRGVTADLRPSGVGELEPVCEEDTDECHAQNRRVEFLIVAEGETAEATEG